ncbi:MAG TPA: hypothetical protein EYP58_00975 [bacterium (Candidatus Stahlbacteria)]|nr:hypothetical protein [Candidatus Stahlbacteria bacterium]
MKRLIIILLILLACSGKKGENRAPELSSVAINPPQPTSSDRLSVTSTVSDPDGDKVVFSYQWFCNDRLITDAEKRMLEPDNFAKGDLISVVVTPNDGKVDGKEMKAEVRIKGTPPSISSAVLDVDTLNHLIAVKVEYSDPDRDPVDLSYRWVVNGEVTELEDQSASLENFRLGDKIMVIVKAEDDDGYVEKNTPLFGGRGQPPVISSQPPTNFSGRHFEYQIEAVDPDGEEITYSFKDAPAGMEVSQSGLVTWDISEEDTLNYRIIIEVRDASGNITFQLFTLNLSLPKK